MTTRIRLRCDYEILGADNGIVFLRDLNLGRTSVTNDAEAVVERMKCQFGLKIRIVYQDSEGEWSEITEGTTWMGKGIVFRPWYGLDWDILSRKDNG